MGGAPLKAGAIHSLTLVRSGPWDKAPAGTAQVDTVAHCGDSLAGAFAHTVNCTDVATLWGALQAQWSKGREVTVESMGEMGRSFPFPPQPQERQLFRGGRERACGAPVGRERAVRHL